MVSIIPDESTVTIYDDDSEYCSWHACCYIDSMICPPPYTHTLSYADVVIGFSPVQFTVNESAGAVNFTIGILSGTLSLDVVVKFYTESITAEGKYNLKQIPTYNTIALYIIIVPSDYENKSTLLTFGPGRSSLQVSVPIVDDILSENNEWFSGNVVSASTFNFDITFDPQKATATILDDDGKIDITKNSY